MLKKIKQYLKSKTINFNLALALVGILELNFHYLKNALGDSYGLAFVAISLIGGYLRHITKTSIKEKK